MWFVMDDSFRFGHRSSAGKLHMENCPAPWRVIKTHVAAQSSDDLLDNAQSEAGATLLARVRSVGLRELLENAGFEVFRNALAVIPHGDTDRVAAVFGCDKDFLAPR